MIDIVLYLISFLLFAVIQALVINGWHECFREGQIFHKMFGKFIDKHKDKWWTMFLWGCVKCESSVIGGSLFWSLVYPLFGVHYFTVLAWILNTFMLVSLNYYFYKKI